ncbi:hypothetical protein [Anaeromassilibacillus senegalensis]|uniref:hypothetical protein n=1 Tax=Anaeromassilibacillus senegalensis TaxID=1673717 RepID=UPI00067F9B6F|nr:hypothetical protein [Anaeromassilibacillus senegalensis]
MNEAIWWIITTVAGLAITIIGFFLKRTISTTDKHGESIHEIEKTYVTQDDFKRYKSQSRDDIQQLNVDINDLKSKCLLKEDYFRGQADVNARLEKIYDLLLEGRRGDHING